MSTLYIVSTPIGNLDDISLRALKTLKEVDLILCEDTRVTKRLLSRYKIETKTLSYHQHSQFKKINHILGLLKEGKRLALVSDAGTPGISDPGNKLIEEIIKSLGEKLNIIPIPGPSAITTLASICGFPMDKFLFLGFPPAKKKRKKYFEQVVNSEHPVIFFESPHRIIKSLGDLSEAHINFKIESQPKIVIGRELTKKFETIYRGNIDQVIKKIEKDKIKGEFVVVVNKK
jgi:16S rRNA (cytidine1402-2'-O)-methyltransferase